MKRSLIVGLVVALLAGSAYVLGYSTFFTVSSVEVIGSNRPINTGIVKGQKLARVEPRAITTKLEKIDWVKSADVSRNWINGKVVVELTSRTPIATFENRVIDSTAASFVPSGPSSRRRSRPCLRVPRRQHPSFERARRLARRRRGPKRRVIRPRG